MVTISAADWRFVRHFVVFGLVFETLLYVSLVGHTYLPVNYFWPLFVVAAGTIGAGLWFSYKGNSSAGSPSEGLPATILIFSYLFSQNVLRVVELQREAFAAAVTAQQYAILVCQGLGKVYWSIVLGGAAGGVVILLVRLLTTWFANRRKLG